MWKSILQQNRDEILRSIDEFEQELQHMRSALANEEYFEVLNILERGKEYRDRLRPGNK